MPLRNRVAPDGSIHAVAARGMLTGNRGIIHDPATRTLLRRRWTVTAWIACRLDYRGRRRAVMSARSWTELFFLDEVTALAAGHRPCFECRRDSAVAFAGAVAAATDGNRPRAGEMDALLHRQRWQSRRDPPLLLSADRMEALPDGAMVRVDGAFLARRDGGWLRWTFGGYETAGSGVLAARPVELVTPPLVLAALSGGYRPQWHAGGQSLP